MKITTTQYMELLRRFEFYKTNEGPWTRLSKIRLGQLFCNMFVNPLEDEVPIDLFKMVDDSEARMIILEKYVEDENLWNNDSVQFMRLLSEIRASGEFRLRGLSIVAKSMDLEIEQVNELFERAELSWQKHLGNISKETILEQFTQPASFRRICGGGGNSD